MKKIIGLLSLAALFTVMACSNDKPAETTKEVIIVPATPPPPPTPVVVVPPPKNTTIVLDKNGVKVGTKKIDVTINPGKKN